jgi:hypothetical protein
MIVERAARCRLIGEQLRDMAARLGAVDVGSGRAVALEKEARELRAIASQVERL